MYLGNCKWSKFLPVLPFLQQSISVISFECLTSFFPSMKVNKFQHFAEEGGALYAELSFILQSFLKNAKEVLTSHVSKFAESIEPISRYIKIQWVKTLKVFAFPNHMPLSLLFNKDLQCLNFESNASNLHFHNHHQNIIISASYY